MNAADKIKILLRFARAGGGPTVFSFHDCLPEVFSKAIELLVSKRVRILGAGEFLERLEASRSRAPRDAHARREVLLTFDDGRRNCWTVIFPLLKKYRVRAVFFVIPSRVKDSQQTYPHLEDYWAGRVSWENLYLSHQRQPYLTWKELRLMQASGFVDVFPHGLRHDVVSVSSRVIDFQHPGVYEMPVYFDEWFERGMPPLESVWGAPIYERAWAPLAGNAYVPDGRAEIVMNDFVRSQGDFLFFRKKDWRKKLFDYFMLRRREFDGRFKRVEQKESVQEAVFESKATVERMLENRVHFFSLPLYQADASMLSALTQAGYRAAFCGLRRLAFKTDRLFLIPRIPGFWLKFLQYF